MNEVIEGYVVKENVLFDNGRGVAFAENPLQPQPYATWMFTEREGERNYEWGRYTTDPNGAQADFAERVDDYLRQYKANVVVDSRRQIRFIDSRYNDLFTVPDGGKVYLKRDDGEVFVRPCRYLDEYHTEIGNYIYHICEFAEKMERAGTTYTPKPPGMALDLPERCYSTLPPGGELVLILRGDNQQHRVSYSSDDPEHNRKLADQNNARLGVTKAAEQAMLFGSIHKWDAPAADPYNYTRDGKPKLPSQQGKRSKSTPGRDR